MLNHSAAPRAGSLANPERAGCRLHSSVRNRYSGINVAIGWYSAAHCYPSSGFPFCLPSAARYTQVSILGVLPPTIKAFSALACLPNIAQDGRESSAQCAARQSLTPPQRLQVSSAHHCSCNCMAGSMENFERPGQTPPLVKPLHAHCGPAKDDGILAGALVSFSVVVLD